LFVINSGVFKEYAANFMPIIISITTVFIS